MTISKGDVFRHVLAGAGGWGDPLERDPAAVLRDVRNELLSAAEGARPTTAWSSTPTAGRSTRRRPRRAAPRSGTRAAGREVPKVQRHDPVAARPRGGVDAHDRSPIASVSTSAAPSPTSCCSAPTARIHTKKISSSVGNYAQAIVDGLSELFAETGLAGGAIEEIRHGTTVASNAILEHKGARVGLITTKGFRDVLEIRTLRMPGSTT